MPEMGAAMVAVAPVGRARMRMAGSATARFAEVLVTGPTTLRTTTAYAAALVI